MWCVGVLTKEYRTRMYELLELYARPLRRDEPVICLDEKSTQLLRDFRAPLPMRPGVALRQDYEYVRGGTCNLFVAVEPKGGQRTVEVTERRGKADFVAFACDLLERVYGSARRVHLVLDNKRKLDVANCSIGLNDVLGDGRVAAAAPQTRHFD